MFQLSILYSVTQYAASDRKLARGSAPAQASRILAVFVRIREHDFQDIVWNRLILLAVVETGRGGAVLTVVVGLNLAAHLDDTAVASARHAVADLEVGLRQGVRLVGRSVADITLGGGLDDVLDLEAGDGLILAGLAAAAVAVDGLGVATSLLGTAAVTTLESHLCNTKAGYGLEIGRLCNIGWQGCAERGKPHAHTDGEGAAPADKS